MLATERGRQELRDLHARVNARLRAEGKPEMPGIAIVQEGLDAEHERSGPRRMTDLFYNPGR